MQVVRDRLELSRLAVQLVEQDRRGRRQRMIRHEYHLRRRICGFEHLGERALLSENDARGVTNAETEQRDGHRWFIAPPAARSAVPSRQQAAMNVRELGHAAPSQHQQAKIFSVGIGFRFHLEMGYDRIGVPGTDVALNAEIAAGLGPGAINPAGRPRREGDLQIRFRVERVSGRAKTSRLQADIAISEYLVGPTILAGLHQPAYAGAVNAVSVCR